MMWNIATVFVCIIGCVYVVLAPVAPQTQWFVGHLVLLNSSLVFEALVYVLGALALVKYISDWKVLINVAWPCCHQSPLIWCVFMVPGALDCHCSCCVFSAMMALAPHWRLLCLSGHSLFLCLNLNWILVLFIKLMLCDVSHSFKSAGVGSNRAMICLFARICLIKTMFDFSNHDLFHVNPSLCFKSDILLAIDMNNELILIQMSS